MGAKWRLRLVRWRRTATRVQNSIGFFPVTMTLGAIALFVLTSALDNRSSAQISAPPGFLGFLVFGGNPDAARNLLGAIAGSWATILGVVFSITLVTVQLMASKYTAEVLSQFEKDKVNQITLGAFLAVYTYSLLVLKTVRSGSSGDEYLPSIGVNVAIVMAVVSLLLLVAFVSNLISFIHPQRFVTSTARSATTSVRGILAPRQRDWISELPEDRAEAEWRRGLNEDGRRRQPYQVKSTQDGYVVGIGWDVLLEVMRERLRDSEAARARSARGSGRVGDRADWRMSLEKRVGDDVSKGDVLAVVESDLSEPELRSVGDLIETSYQLAGERRPRGDPEYGLIVLGSMGERTVSADSDARVAAECVRGIFRVLAEVMDSPRPSRSLVVHAGSSSDSRPSDGPNRRRGGAILVERPKVDLFEVATTSLSRIVLAAVDKQLGTVPLELSRRAASLLLAQARRGRVDQMQHLLGALRPSLERAILRLELLSLVDMTVGSLADLAATLREEGREIEARAVGGLLADLRQAAAGSRPEVAALFDRTD